MNLKKIIALPCLFALTSNFLLAQSPVNIKMTKESGVWALPGKVNGAPMKFIFDPGAADVSISLTEARYLLKNNLMASSDIIDYQKYQTASGEIEVGWKIYLRELEIGGLKLPHVEASIVNSPNAPILLGQSALSRLGVLTEDFSAGILVIVPHNYSSQVSENSDSQVSYSSESTASGLAADYYGRLPQFTGDVTVCTYAPILQKPDMVYSPTVGKADGNSATIVRRENEKYYYVRSGNTSGFLWVGWIRQ